ncbi:hypothetical protein [Actinoplanes sp. NPDC049599]|uniref:hypothetical protein n=1 Tax=Actinoplanes sp. NPDC049599 TaxID=3363903 RepID=UPI00378FF3B5
MSSAADRSGVAARAVEPLVAMPVSWRRIPGSPASSAGELFSVTGKQADDDWVTVEEALWTRRGVVR